VTSPTRPNNAVGESPPVPTRRSWDSQAEQGPSSVVGSPRAGGTPPPRSPAEKRTRGPARLASMGRVVTEGFRAPEVCQIIGITYRQLDYWTRTGLIQPGIADAKGSGSRRLFSFRDLVLLKAIKDLLDAGLSLQKVREAIDYVRSAVSEDPTEATLTARQGTIVVYGPDEQDLLIDALRRGQITLSLPLAPIYEELEQKVREIEAARRRHPSSDKRARRQEVEQLTLFD